MSFADVHGRFGAFVDAVQERYPTTDDPDVDPAWACGQVELHSAHNWNRIVGWFSEARVRGPLEGSTSKRDTCVATRIIPARLRVWARDAKTAENMIHALIVAIDAETESVASSFAVGAMSEAWYPNEGDIVSGGVIVELRFDLAINVFTSDTRVITEGANPGAGVPPSEATTLIITSDGMPDHQTPPA